MKTRPLTFLLDAFLYKPAWIGYSFYGWCTFHFVTLFFYGVGEAAALLVLESQFYQRWKIFSDEYACVCILLFQRLWPKNRENNEKLFFIVGF